MRETVDTNSHCSDLRLKGKPIGKSLSIGLLACAMIGSASAQTVSTAKIVIAGASLDSNAERVPVEGVDGALGDTLRPFQSLFPGGQSLISSDGRFELVLQRDGNLVLYRRATGYALWASGTSGRDVREAAMQGDGNFVIYLYSGQAIWASYTDGNPGSFLVLQSDGNVVIYRPNTPLWATGTCCFGAEE